MLEKLFGGRRKEAIMFILTDGQDQEKRKTSLFLLAEHRHRKEGGKKD